MGTCRFATGTVWFWRLFVGRPIDTDADSFGITCEYPVVEIKLKIIGDKFTWKLWINGETDPVEFSRELNESFAVLKRCINCNISFSSRTIIQVDMEKVKRDFDLWQKPGENPIARWINEYFQGNRSN